MRSAPRRRQSSVPRKSACVGTWAWVPPKRAGHALRRRGIHVHAPLVRPHDGVIVTIAVAIGRVISQIRSLAGVGAGTSSGTSSVGGTRLRFAPNVRTVVRSQPSPLAARQVTFQPHTPPTPAAITTIHRPRVAILPSHRHPAAGTPVRGHTGHSKGEEVLPRIVISIVVISIETVVVPAECILPDVLDAFSVACRDRAISFPVVFGIPKASEAAEVPESMGNAFPSSVIMPSFTFQPYTAIRATAIIVHRPTSRSALSGLSPSFHHMRRRVQIRRVTRQYTGTSCGDRKTAIAARRPTFISESCLATRLGRCQC